MREYFDKLYKGNLDEFSDILLNKLKKNEKAFVVTANPETLMIGQKNEKFHKILLNEHTTITADGIGVIKGAQMLGYDISDRVTGVDIVKNLFVSADQEQKSIYLFGAKPEVVKKLAEKLSKEYKGLKVLGYTDGYVENKEAEYEKIITLKPDIVLVALGIPAQELLIEKYYDRFDKGIFVGIGGAFDVLSGMKRRAPEFFVKHNLEWLYRICREPKRFKRFYQSNIRYIRIIKHLQKEKKNEEN